MTDVTWLRSAGGLLLGDLRAHVVHVDALRLPDEVLQRRFDLAASLNNLSLRLADLGRREEALAAAHETEALQRLV